MVFAAAGQGFTAGSFDGLTSAAATAEAALSSNEEFGSAARIIGSVNAIYDISLELMAPLSPSISALQAAGVGTGRVNAARTWLSPTVRIVLNDWLQQFQSGLGLPDDRAGREVIEHAVERVGSASGAGAFRIWDPEAEAAADTRRFLSQWSDCLRKESDDGQPMPLSPRAPRGSEVEAVRAAFALLGRALPELADSLMAHVHWVVLLSQEASPASGPESETAGGQVLSMSDHAMPGSIFLGEGALADVWATAEALCHEACHQRLYDLMTFHQIHSPTYEPENSRGVIPPWYAGEAGVSRSWPTDRVLAAYHVYVHLLTFWLVALAGMPELAGEDGADDRARIEKRFRRAFGKALFLRDGLRGELWDELGDSGRRLVALLSEGLGVLAGAAATAGLAGEIYENTF
jgi:HEXXH motif-containing protein